MIKRFFKKMWTAQAQVDNRSPVAAFGLGLFLGSWLGLALIGWLTGAPKVQAAAQPAAQTAPQVKSVETEKELMSRFLSGLEDLERALDDWFFLHKNQLEEPDPSPQDAAGPNGLAPIGSARSVWFLSDKASPALTPSVSALLDCRVEDPKAQFPKCRGNVYSFYDVQCDSDGCSWTLCRHNKTPHSCTYSMNGYRGRFGRWENNCNAILPQSFAWCEYLRKEKGFIINDFS